MKETHTYSDFEHHSTLLKIHNYILGSFFQLTAVGDNGEHGAVVLQHVKVECRFPPGLSYNKPNMEEVPAVEIIQDNKLATTLLVLEIPDSRVS